MRDVGVFGSHGRDIGHVRLHNDQTSPCGILARVPDVVVEKKRGCLCLVVWALELLVTQHVDNLY